jgi:energy-coupling factor transporter ATP-binding protein EcfA2
MFNIEEGSFDLPNFKLRWPELIIEPGTLVFVSGSSDAPVSDFFFFFAGLQRLRRITNPALKGEIIRQEVHIDESVYQKVKYDGRSVYDFSAQERASCIGFVFNDPELSIVGATAFEDISQAFSAINLEPPSPRRCLSYGFNQDILSRSTDVLSGGELHRLACLIAIERNPSVLFFDLTRSNLDRCFVEELKEKILKLIDEGCIIFLAGLDSDFFSSQIMKLDVNDDGCLDVIREDGTRCGVGCDTLFAERIQRPIVANQETLIVDNLCRVGVTSPVTFKVYKNEILTIYGDNGSGKTTLGLIISGRCKKTDYSGSYKYTEPNRPVVALQYAARAFIEDSIIEEHKIASFWHELGFSDDDITAHPRSLGYGKMKLAATALALLRSDGFCILDEPTCGMDMKNKILFVELLKKHSDTTILIFSHDEFLRYIGRSLNFKEIVA